MEDTACVAAADLFLGVRAVYAKGPAPIKCAEPRACAPCPACAAPPLAAWSPSRRAAACWRHGAKLAAGSSSIRRHGSKLAPPWAPRGRPAPPPPLPVAGRQPERRPYLETELPAGQASPLTENRRLPLTSTAGEPSLRFPPSLMHPELSTQDPRA
jgi:hypothetical protein